MKFAGKKVVFGLLMLLAVLFVAPRLVEAKASVKKLKVNKTYTAYDVTGDKKADTFKLSSQRDAYYDYFDYSVSINGKKALSKKSGSPISGFDIYRLELKNGKVFVAIVPESTNGDVFDAAVYQYKSGKLKSILNLYNMGKIGYHNNVSSVKVSGNTVRVKHQVMSYSLGMIEFWLDYQYKGGKLVQKSTQTKLTNTYLKLIKKSYWTAKQSMKLYSKPGGKKTATVAKGNQVKIDKIYLNAKHNKIYLHVKIKGGKSGWVKGLTKYPSFGAELFEEVVYAG